MLRLVSDADVHGDIVRNLCEREPTLDLVRVQDVGLRTADDPDILEWAASEGRTLVTNDRSTMPGFAYRRVRAGLALPGVIVLNDRMSIRETMEEILIVTICYNSGEMKDQVVFLPL